MMAQTAQTSIAELLAEAKLSLDTALQRAAASEPEGSLSSATLATLAAAAGNTSCVINTGCSARRQAAAEVS
jgi:hypothetical protein